MTVHAFGDDFDRAERERVANQARVAQLQLSECPICRLLKMIYEQVETHITNQMGEPR